MSGREDNVAERIVELAMLIMVVAMLLLPAIDALAKVLSATVPVGLIVWSRFAFQTTLLAPDALRKQHSAQSGLQLTHATRGGLLALTTLMFFVAVRVLPLAEAFAKNTQGLAHEIAPQRPVADAFQTHCFPTIIEARHHHRRIECLSCEHIDRA